MPEPSLYTSRLILRAFRREDARRVRELAGVFEIADTTGHMPHPYLEGMAEEWIGERGQEFASGVGATFAITLRETGDVIGAISLSMYSPHPIAELGYWVGVPYWNHGYTTEAARAVLEYAFAELKLNRVYASYFPRNPASGRVMEKVGMKYEGTLRQHFVRWDKPEDLVYYGILKTEWDGQASR